MAADNKTIHWLHLSDFHVGKDGYATRKMFDYILAHVGKRKEEGFMPDLLFLTGDLANKGLASEYETFWLEFVSPLQELIGGEIGQRTFAVPGNHDVDRTKHTAFSREEISKADSHYLDPTKEGVRLRGEMLTPRLKSYLDNDCSPTKGAFASLDGAFAHCLTIQGHEVGIVGINTAWLSKDDKDERQLTPGKPLLENALNAIDHTKLRIVLGHHPIDWFRLDQQKPIKSVLGQLMCFTCMVICTMPGWNPLMAAAEAFLPFNPVLGSRRGKARNGAMVWSGEKRTWVREKSGYSPGIGTRINKRGHRIPILSTNTTVMASGGITHSPARNR